VDSLLLYPAQVDKIFISSIWGCTLTRRYRTVISIIHVTESYWKSIVRL